MADIKNSENENLNNAITDHTNQIIDLKIKLNEINAKLQAVTDFSDDLITAHSALTSHLDTASSALISHADNVLTWYIGLFTIIIGAVVTLITMWFGKTKAEHLQEATDKIIRDLVNNETLRDEFIKKIVEHPNIRANINLAIEGTTKDKVKSAVKDNLKQMLDGIGE
jgi:predicted PurR-regulated permease PerM